MSVIGYGVCVCMGTQHSPLCPASSSVAAPLYGGPVIGRTSALSKGEIRSYLVRRHRQLIALAGDMAVRGTPKLTAEYDARADEVNTLLRYIEESEG